MREAEKEKAELAAVLAMQTLDVEGDVSGLRPLDEQDVEYVQDEEDLEMSSAIPYDRAMSPEPVDTLAREDQNLAIVDQWDDWAEIVSLSAFIYA